MRELPASIRDLDFRMIGRKLEHRSGRGWPRERTVEVEREYRRFLGLKYLFPEVVLVPDESIDTFWHFHIADTRAYARDCERVFGRFMHHNPYFGIRTEADGARLREAFKVTVSLYEEVYGPSPPKSWLKPAVCSL